MKVLFKQLDPLAIIPNYQTLGSVGADVSSIEEVNLGPGEVKAIRLGFSVAVPDGYELQVRPRSGLALNHSITVLNSPGTIDIDFTGEVRVILANLGTQTFLITQGCRIAQIVLNKVERIEFEEVIELPKTARGAGGFGSTGFVGVF